MAEKETPTPCDSIDWSGDTLFTSTAPAFLYDPLRGAGGGFSQKIPWEDGYIGIIVAADTPLDRIALFQADKLLHWKQVHCGPLEGGMSYDVKMQDLNFDGHKDLLMDVHSGGNFGKSSVGFVFNPQSKTFEHNKALTLENMSVDAKNKCLRARHYSSIYGGRCKWLYAWKADSLVMMEEAIYHADYDSASIKIQKRQADGSMQESLIQGKTEPVWKIFDQRCLWKGEFSID